MSLGRIFLQRAALGVVAAWSVLTIVFGLFTVTRNWNIEQRVAAQQWAGGLSEEEAESQIQAYLGDRGLNRPIHEQYIDWVGGMFTLDWGTSLQTGDPVRGMVVDATVRTAMYVLPATGIAITVGLLIGLYAAMNPDSPLAGLGIGSSYLAFAVPNYFVGGMLLSLASAGIITDSDLLFDHALPVVLTASSLLGGYVSFTRAHAMEYVREDFVTLVKAKGARRIRVAYHVLRNGAIPLFSMLFTEALALLVLAVFVVERLFDISGLGLLLYDAIYARDLPVLLGGTMVLVLVGVIANIIQDVAYTQLDPRVDTGSR